MQTPQCCMELRVHGPLAVSSVIPQTLHHPSPNACTQVGMRLHQRRFELLQDCWGAWQLFVLQVQAHRRAAMLWNAAEAFR